MTDKGDRMTRAGNYVLGLMDEDERERAEHDLEIDPSFRDAVVAVAERMHVFDRAAAPERTPEDGWKLLKDQMAGMPQMRAAPERLPEPPVAPEAPVAFGRRRSDAMREKVVPAAPPKVMPIALHSVPSRRAMVMAAGIIAAFALGYFAGVSSVSESPPIAISQP